MTRYDDLRAKWFALIDGIPVVDEAADALIAAAAIVSGRTLITENWRDFHFIDDLSFVDIRGITPADLPVVSSRPVQTGGPVAGAGCCRKLIRSRAAT